MTEKDKVGKVLADYNDVFADIYNTLLFSKPYLKEAELMAGPTESIYKTTVGGMAGQYRDVLKNYGKVGFVICSMGIENQTTVDNTMPVRIMSYDAASYKAQIAGEQGLAPVVTIVLNFSYTKWNGAKSLHELLDIPEELKPFVQDYRIQVFDIAFLDDEVIEKFTSDFKAVAKFFKAKRLKRDACSDDRISLKHVEAVLDLLRVFTGDSRYQYWDELKSKVAKGEPVFMCYVAESIEQKGIQKGIGLGELKTLKSLLDNKVISEEDAAKHLNKSIEELPALFAKL